MATPDRVVTPTNVVSPMRFVTSIATVTQIPTECATPTRAAASPKAAIYACTIVPCAKTFLRMEDWQKHEKYSHGIQRKVWMCQQAVLEDGSDAHSCMTLWYFKARFEEHLEKWHKINLRYYDSSLDC